MTSQALAEWRGHRHARLQELRDAHTTVGGSGAGRRWRTEQINWALVLRLAAEFQGFARELHDEAIACFIGRAAAGNPALESILKTRLSVDRELTRGNAHPGALGNDFGRLGLRLWPELTSTYTRAAQWNRTLETLNTARNAIAHADDAKMTELATTGWPLGRLATADRFARAADGLAGAMDNAVSAHLAHVFGGPRPW